MYQDNNPNLNDLNQVNKPALNNEQPTIEPEIKHKLEPNKPKKGDYVIIYIIAAIVIGLIVTICVFAIKDYSNSKANEQESSIEENTDTQLEETPKEEEEKPVEKTDPIVEEEEDQTNKPQKTIAYYNASSRTVTDKLAFTLESSTSQGKGVLIGFSGKNIAQNLKGDSLYLKNEFISISKYNSRSELSLTYNQAPLNFKLSKETYKKDNTGEYLNDQLILYKDKNFIIVKGNRIENNDTNPYNLYYYYGIDNTYPNTWDLIHLVTGSTIDDLKRNINAMRQDFTFCAYDKKTGPSNCITESNQKINYNAYKNFNDVLIDSLIDYNLYIDNYEYITSFSSGRLELEKYINLDGAIGNNKVKYHITFPACSTITEEVKLITKLNGSDFKLTKPYNSYTGYLTTTNGCPKILIVLPSGVDVNTNNAMKVVRITFSKTKKD